ncbi:MAG: FAD-dependent oxidoreductase [Bacteroidetes bacterium]|nr:FAD-dependent oxidoreductase [Bacteroidota bacterium]
MREVDFDICVIGAGVAGASIAAYLGRHGFRVAVVEKDMREQDRIVGELMQPGGVTQLQEMGLGQALEGYDAQEITGYALFLRDQHFSIEYPGAQTGRGLRNGKLLQALRAELLAQKNITVLEGNAVSLTEADCVISGVQYIPKGADTTATVNAALTIVCDGMFSAFREKLSDTTKTVSSYFLGLLMKDCELPFPGHGHVIAAEPSPVLVYPVSSEETRVLIDFPSDQAPRKGEELTHYLRETIGSQMPKEIQPAYYRAVEEGKFRVMPNHLIPANPRLKAGAVLVGDSLNMRHPLTGGGMTVALTDVHNLADRLIAIRETFAQEQIEAAVAAFYETRYAANASINILADALYKVMSDPDLKEACYSYLQQGGKKSEVPLSLLSAINRDSNKLIQHFFAVAVHGAKRIILPHPTPANISRSYRMIRNAVHIISPLVLSQRPGMFTRATFSVAEKVFA